MADEDHQVRRPALNEAYSATSNWFDEKGLDNIVYDFILLRLNLPVYHSNARDSELSAGFFGWEFFYCR